MDGGKRTKRWRIVAAIAAVLAIFLTAASLSARRPPFEFIDKFGGVAVKSPYMHLEVDSVSSWPMDHEPVLSCYAFRPQYETVKKAFDEELVARGWHPIWNWAYGDNDDHTQLFLNWKDASGKRDFPEEVTCYIVISHYPTWPEKQWTTVNAWFGGPRG